MDAYYVLIGFLIVLGVGIYFIADKLGRAPPEASEDEPEPTSKPGP